MIDPAPPWFSAGDQAGRPGFQQVDRDVALADGGGHDGPGPHDSAAQVGPDRQAEAVEPLGVRGVAAEPGGQVVAGAGPLATRGRPLRTRDFDNHLSSAGAAS
jgi:hypothetical protein